MNTLWVKFHANTLLQNTSVKAQSSILLAEDTWYNYHPFTGPLYQWENWGREQVRLLNKSMELQELEENPGVWSPSLILQPQAELHLRTLKNSLQLATEPEA